MPKAKPLPDDPEEREKILRQRRDAVERQKRWRKRHPDTHRVITLFCVRRWLLKQEMRKRLHSAA